MVHNNKPDFGSTMVWWCYKLRLLEGRLVTNAAYMCGAVFLLYSFYVALEVVGRHYFGVYTGITDEIGGYVLAFGSSLALAYTLMVDGHVRIDILFKAISSRQRLWLDILAFAVMTIFAWTVTIYLWKLTAYSYKIGATGHSLIQMPQWLIQGCLALGYTWLGFFSLTSCLSYLMEAVYPGSWSDPLRLGE